jgi:ubiquinone/menaquinone biosynthesis C-methylase UbiE
VGAVDASVGKLGARLRERWSRRRRRDAEPPARLPDEAFVERHIEECRRLHDGSGYYAIAEADMEQQWRDTILPRIRGADFTRVLELAPGHGRNTRKLMELAREIHLVDVNRSCIDACRERFGPGDARCRLHYHVNDGRSLDFLPDASVSFVYSWDSMVHFDRRVVAAYVSEFARVLAPGGTGFVHHSNYGAFSDHEIFHENPAWRSNVSRELFAAYCAEAGLEIIEQQLLWWFIDDLDCLSVFRKPAVPLG